MTNTNKSEAPKAHGWRTSQVYVMAGVCLAVGLLLGYLFRGSASQSAPALQVAQASTASVPGGHPTAPQAMPSLDDMKRMADKQAEPLLAKLKNDPKNSDLLNQVGLIYKATHQFKAASEYFQKAVDANPRNIPARTELASCLFYQGDSDGAIRQLQQSLTFEPSDANSLFNLGVIRLQAKNDPGGAIKAWQQLLKSNPKLLNDKKAAVQNMIAEARKPKVTQ